MKYSLTAALFLAATSAFAAGDYPIQPVPFTAVKLTDDFWAPRIQRNHDVTIPIALQQCYDTGRVDNFLKAAKHEGKFGTEFPFDDTDIYKIIEGASYTLATVDDPKLSAKVDELITIIAGAQEPDGYLYTARTIDPAHPHKWSGPERWVKESDLSHELYNSGHLFEAAFAHYTSTGKRTLLDIALKNADLLCSVFGPGKRIDAPGHQIVEMGLVKLYRATGKQAYLDLAKFFLDTRGRGKAYSQDNKPVVDQTEAVGHAVRATYMYSGMADVAALTGDAKYLHAIDAIWDDVVSNKLYLTGGIGATAKGEAFGRAYELPNATAYNETCAAIGNVYWNHRLFLLHGDAKFYDVLERTLYNGLISGVSLSGDHFFYPNPLESKGGYARKAWFGCACCPSNLCRFIPSVSGYVYATTPERVFVNLYASSTAHLKFGAHEVELVQKTQYPWEGSVELTVNPAAATEFDLALRIPGWAQEKPTPSDLYTFTASAKETVGVLVNGQKVEATHAAGDGYVHLKRAWKKGDRIALTLPMPVRAVVANSEVAADQKRVAFERGPVVYCIESTDTNGASARALQLAPATKTEATFKKDLLGGVTVLEGKSADEKPFTAIPYYAWANRGASEMEVWFPTEPATAAPTTAGVPSEPGH